MVDEAEAADLAALGHQDTLGDDDVARLAQAVRYDPDPRVRAAALAALARHAERAGETGLSCWRAAARDEDPSVRRRAAEVAPGLRGIASGVVDLLDDPDTFVAEAAAFALGELGDEARGAGAVARLARAVRDHDDSLVREAAVAALGALGDDEGLASVLEALDDRPPVRRRAVLALAAFEGSEVEAALHAALADRDWQVRQAAEDLLRADS